MKFHVVAASDMLSKNLDPTFPHNTLGHDGLLLPLDPKQEVKEAVLINTLDSQPYNEEISSVEIVEEVVGDNIANVTEEKKLTKPKGRPAKAQ